jgi:sterol desaturase/sphingolipid hydroxylase (fatty acid hydroxylase superfamily)
MDLFASDQLGLRLFIPLALVASILVIESFVPFRVPIQSRLEHISTNLVIFGGNSVVAYFVSTLALVVLSGYIAREGWGLLYHVQLDPFLNIVLSLILLDFIAYAVHRLYHRVPLLWRFHRAHHSDLDIDATTSLRFHLGEVLITMGIKGFSVIVLGISPAGFLLSETVTLAAALFSHSNLKLPNNLELHLQLAIVTPSMHWIHHSRRPVEHNTNLGAVFSGWDRLFGSYYMGVARHDIHFGLDEYPTPEDVSLLRFARMPFDNACRPIDRQRTVDTSTGARVKISRM